MVQINKPTDLITIWGGWSDESAPENPHEFDMIYEGNTGKTYVYQGSTGKWLDKEGNERS